MDDEQSAEAADRRRVASGINRFSGMHDLKSVIRIIGIATIGLCALSAVPSSAQSPANEPPNAVLDIEPEPPVASVGESLTFKANRSTDANGGTLTYSWRFGDGQTGSGVQVAHSYASAGRFTVRLTVTDPQGAASEVTRDVQVLASALNNDPVAHIATGPRTGTAPAALTFDGRGSFDVDGDPITHDWIVSQSGTIVDQSEGSLVSLVFSQPGEYEIVLRVSDDRGGVDETEPEEVLISERVIDDGDDDSNDGDDGGDDGNGEEPPGRLVPDSADQRPTIACGFGMLGAMLGSMIGLTAMRRRRP